MAAEEIFTAGAIITFVLVGTFLTLYLVKRKENPVFSDAALIGVFSSMIFGLKLIERAFKVLDPISEIDKIANAFLQVTLYLLIIAVIVLFIRMMIIILRGISTGKWEGWEKIE